MWRHDPKVLRLFKYQNGKSTSITLPQWIIDHHEAGWLDSGVTMAVDQEGAIFLSFFAEQPFTIHQISPSVFSTYFSFDIDEDHAEIPLSSTLGVWPLRRMKRISHARLPWTQMGPSTF